MTTRVLPPAEWPRLVGTELEPVIPHLDAARVQVLVVEHEGAIVGTWMLMTVKHAEGLWIAPEHRKRGAVARHLWRGLRQAAREAGFPVVATTAMSDEVRALLEHVGATKVPGEHYAMEMS